MPAQTSYSVYTGSFNHGQLVDMNPTEVDALAAESAIGFGLVCKRGTDKDDQLLVGAASWAAAFGITIRDTSRQLDTIGATTLSYDIGEMVSVLRNGKIALTLAAGGNAGDAIKYNTTTGVIDVGAPGGGEAAITGATLETTISAGAVGVIRIRA